MADKTEMNVENGTELDETAEVKESEAADTSAKADSKKAGKKPKKAKSHKNSNYLKELKSELGKITWYSRKDTVNNTIWVCIAMVIIAAVIGLVDIGLSQGLSLMSGIFS